MIRGAVFVEELSMAEVIEGLTRTLGLEGAFQIISHDGKTDLRSSFPRKLASWKHPADAKFLIVEDNDNGICSARKGRLVSLLPSAQLPRCKFRIVMQCLESWYLGEPEALAEAGIISQSDLRYLLHKRYSNPEIIMDPKKFLLKKLQISGQIAIARAVSAHMRPERNRSTSFRHTVAALRWIANA